MNWQTLSLISVFGVLFSFSLSVRSENKVTLQLKWFHSFQFAGYYAAKHQGYYSDAGFNVEILPININSSPLESVVNGDAEFGVSDSSIVLHRLNKKPVVIATSIFQTSPLVFISLREQNITSAYDLRDKRIMFQKSIDDAPLQALIRQIGLEEQDYNYVSHNYEDDALLSGDVDVMSAYRSDQPTFYKLKNIDVNIIDPASYGIDFYGDMLFTSESYIEQNIDSVEKFVEATRKGWLYALEHKDEIIFLLQQDYGVTTSTVKLMEEATIIESLIRPQFIPIGTLFPKRFELIEQVYKDLGAGNVNGNIDGLFLSDYKSASYTFNHWVIYGFSGLLVFALLLSFGQHWFNRKLLRLVHSKTDELERLNYRLTQNNLQLSEATEIAESANTAKSLFLSNMSHEIRTPLNGIYGALQLFSKNDLTTKNQELVEYALQSSKSLMTIINDILDYSKIEAGKLVFEELPFKFNEIVDSVVLDLSVLVEKKELNFNVEIDEDYQDGWIGDFVRVKQVLLNLSSNAVKFTSQGEVTIRVMTGKSLRFSIQDTGEGIPNDLKHKLFNRFEQVNVSTTRKYGGTGLGLSIVESLVNMMKGKVKVRSEMGVGSCFDVSLPLKPYAKPTKEPTTSVAIQTPDFSSKCILVADDNEVNRIVVGSMLKETNASLVFVSDGLEAVNAVEETIFDLILMDIQMPNLDGLEACIKIKKEHNNLPIVALTLSLIHI